MLRRPTTFLRATVPATGAALVEPDSSAPASSVRRVTILLENDIQVGLDQTLDAIAASRGFAWPTIPGDVGRVQFFLQPAQYLNAISRNSGLATCSVIVEYFDQMPGL